MKQPFFSIIMVCYNDSKYLHKSFSFIAGQSFRDFELVFIVNGSTDSTESVLQDFMNQNPDISVVVGKIEKNNGLPNGRNKGLSLASGEYILFHDADDWMDYDCLELAYDTIQKKQTDLVIQEVKFINEQENIIEVLDYSEKPSRWTKNTLQGNFFRREVFEKNDIQFSYKAYYDDFFVTALFNSYTDSFQVVRSSHYNMLYRSSSMTHVDRNQMELLFHRFDDTFAEMTDISERIPMQEYPYYEYDCIQRYLSAVYSGVLLSFTDKCRAYKSYKSIMDKYYPNYLMNSQVTLFKENGFKGHFKRNIWLSIVLERIDRFFHGHLAMYCLLLIYHISLRCKLYIAK